MYGLYITIVVAFCSALAWSTFKSLLEMSPKRPTEVEQLLTVNECIDEAENLWVRLDDERKGLTRGHPARAADEAWSRFRVEWLRDLRALEARCAVESRSRTNLRPLFEQLDSLQDLYMTHAVQYAGEVGPAVDKLQAEIKRLRQNSR